MNISIKSIPAAQQRYDTWGDWMIDESGDLTILVSNDLPELPTEDHQFLVALHELVEVWLCRKAGVTQDQVDAFDMGPIASSLPDGAEPGDHPGAPYRIQHGQAMLVEGMMAGYLGVKMP